MSRLLQILPPESSNFIISHDCEELKKFAPGMETTVLVTFTPDSKADFSDYFTIVTEREKYIMPLRCIGARGYLDLADIFTFPQSIVKCPRTESLMVTNIGQKDCRFTLKTTTECFHALPLSGKLAPGEKASFTLIFTPQVLSLALTLSRLLGKQLVTS